MAKGLADLVGLSSTDFEVVMWSRSIQRASDIGIVEVESKVKSVLILAVTATRPPILLEGAIRTDVQALDKSAKYRTSTQSLLEALQHAWPSDSDAVEQSRLRKGVEAFGGEAKLQEGRRAYIALACDGVARDDGRAAGEDENSLH